MTYKSKGHTMAPWQKGLAESKRLLWRRKAGTVLSVQNICPSCNSYYSNPNVGQTKSRALLPLLWQMCTVTLPQSVYDPNWWDIRKKVYDDTLFCISKGNLKTSWDVLSLVTESCLLAQHLPHQTIFSIEIPHWSNNTLHLYAKITK